MVMKSDNRRFGDHDYYHHLDHPSPLRIALYKEAGCRVRMRGIELYIRCDDRAKQMGVDKASPL